MLSLLGCGGDPCDEMPAAEAAVESAKLECAYIQGCDVDHAPEVEDMTEAACVDHFAVYEMSFVDECSTQGATFDGCAWEACADRARDALKSCGDEADNCGISSYYKDCDLIIP